MVKFFRRCMTKKCRELVLPGSTHKRCKMCRSGLRYWRGKRVDLIDKRRDRLTMLHSRLDFFTHPKQQELRSPIVKRGKSWRKRNTQQNATRQARRPIPSRPRVRPSVRGPVRPATSGRQSSVASL